MANLLTWAERKYLPDKRNLHMRVLSGDYYWFMTIWFYDIAASNSETEYIYLIPTEANSVVLFIYQICLLYTTFK
jgi:hypothetical protein